MLGTPEECWNLLTRAEMQTCDQCKTVKMCTFTDNPKLQDNVDGWWCRNCWFGAMRMKAPE
jgi:hypothetical protein